MSSTQVIEFGLDDKRYCIDLDNVAEIVNKEDLTPLPNTPNYIEGLMDLRGNTTTIINPKKIFNLSNQVKGKRILILDQTDNESKAKESKKEESGSKVDENEKEINSESQGWIVDEVYEVKEVSKDDVDEPVDNDSMKGVIKKDEKDDNFIIWVKPITQ